MEEKQKYGGKKEALEAKKKQKINKNWEASNWEWKDWDLLWNMAVFIS